MSETPYLADIVEVAKAVYQAYLDEFSEDVVWIAENAPDKERAYAVGFLTGVEMALRAVESGAIREIGQN